jgi:hypothetical protein
MSNLTLDDIFNEPDELGILRDDTPEKVTTTIDDRTRSGYEEINSFYNEFGREPLFSEDADIREK